MDEYTADAFANRDEPVPLIAISHSDVEASSKADAVSRTERLERSRSPSQSKAKDQELPAAQLEQNEASPGGGAGRVSLQGRLFSK